MCVWHKSLTGNYWLKIALFLRHIKEWSTNNRAHFNVEVYLRCRNWPLVITIKVKSYQVTGYAWTIYNAHFYKHIYLHMICKTMSTSIFRNKNEKGKNVVKNKVIKKINFQRCLTSVKEKNINNLSEFFEVPHFRSSEHSLYSSKFSVMPNYKIIF